MDPNILKIAITGNGPDVKGANLKDPESEVKSPLHNGDCEKGMMKLHEEEEERPARGATVAPGDCYCTGRSSLSSLYADSLVPDGGWGWVVCAGSFMVNFILDGTMFSFGILLLELLEDFGETKSVTSWVGSAQLGMSMMMGPLVSVLLKRFSLRQVAIAGTLVSAAGFFASVFAPNVYVLIVMYGIVGGSGICMTFLPSIIVVGLYFSKKRAIATGIATSGSGIGTFVYAYVCDMLLQHFTWRQTILILTGFMLNCLACGMLFRPLIPSSRANRNRKCCRGGSGSCSSSEYSGESEEGETTAMMKKGKDVGSINPFVHAGTGVVKGVNDDVAALARSDLGLYEQVKKVGKQTRGVNLAAFIMMSQQLRHSRHRHHRRHHHHHQKDPLLIHHTLTTPAHTHSKFSLPASLVRTDRLSRSVEHIAGPLSTSILPVTDKKLQYFSETQLAPEYLALDLHKDEKSHIAMGLLRPILRKDIYYSGSVSHLAEYQVCGRSMNSFLAHMTQSVSSDVSSLTPSKEETGLGRESRWHQNLFRNKSFLFLLVTFTLWTVQAVPLTYLPNLAVSKGIERQDAAFLISVVGITNTVARIVAGIVTDALRVRSIWLYVVALLWAAGVNFVIPWCNSFSMLCAAAAVFGICMAVAVSMRTIVLAEQLGIEVLTKSFGVVALFQGLAFTVNPPLAGKLFDETGAYIWPFTMAGFMYLVSGLSALVVAMGFKPQRRAPRSFILTVEKVDTESPTVSRSSSSNSDASPSSVK